MLYSTSTAAVVVTSSDDSIIDINRKTPPSSPSKATKTASAEQAAFNKHCFEEFCKHPQAYIPPPPKDGVHPVVIWAPTRMFPHIVERLPCPVDKECKHPQKWGMTKPRILHGENGIVYMTRYVIFHIHTYICMLLLSVH